MNRRTVLRSAGVFATLGLAGCLGGIRDHFEGEIQSPVQVELYNEGDRTYNIQLEARERGTDRGTYDQGITIIPDERVSAPSLDGYDQSFRAMRIDQSGDEDLVEVGAITSETQYVQITVYDDEIDLEISTNEEDDPEPEGNESGEDNNETDEMNDDD